MYNENKTGFDTVIVRYSELALKGKNRGLFEKVLVNNIRKCLYLNNIQYDQISRIRGRIHIKTSLSCTHLRNVFGISSFSQAISTSPDIHSLKDATKKFFPSITNSVSFRISASRSDKTVPVTSSGIEMELGAFVVDKTKAKVSLNHFDFEVGVEIFDGSAYVFCHREKGLGGLPLGVSGKVIILFESVRSILSAWLMMKRGCDIIVVDTGNNDENIKFLKKFSYGSKTEGIKCSIKEMAHVSYRKNINTIVSDQTLENLHEYNLSLTVLRPLIGYQEKDINKMLNNIKKTD